MHISVKVTELVTIVSLLILFACADYALERCKAFTHKPDLVNQTQTMVHPFYLHVPKCGSSFITAIIEVTCLQISVHKTVLEPGLYLRAKQPSCIDRFARVQSGHHGLPEEIQQNPQNVMTMIRNPVRRVASGFLHCFHDCLQLYDRFCKSPHLQKNCSKSEFYQHAIQNKSLVLEYATCVRGLMTEQLLSPKNTKRRKNRKLFNSTEIGRAVNIMDRIGFVGLTERFDESVCLLRAMYGGNISKHSFQPARVSISDSLENRIEKILVEAGWVDEADEQVYAAGVRNFFTKRIRYLRSESESST
eukprot:gene19-3415_t